MRFAAILVLTAGVLAAQPATSALQDWGNLKRLAPGEEIRVSTSDGKSYRGALRNVADDSLIVVTAAGEQSLARAQVVKAAFKKQGHRARNTLIGLGVGAAGGLAVGAGIDAHCTGDCGFYPGGLGKAVFTPFGALIGTIIGVAWPTGGWHDVYRTK